MQKPWEKYHSPEALTFDKTNIGNQTLAQMCREASRTYGDRPALTTMLPTGAQTTITYAELDALSDQFAGYLREDIGLAAGETVALMSPNCIGFCVASMGIAKAGCINTNVNPLYTAQELEHQLTDGNAKALVIVDLFGDKVDQVVGHTNVKHVVTLSLVDFFPMLKKAFLGFVLKRVRKVVPDISTPHVRMSDALARGRKSIAGKDVAAYAKQVKPSDTALLQYTSGTTGRSKGAELSHSGVLLNAHQGYLMVEDEVKDGAETALIALPLYHITAYVLIFILGMKLGSHAVLAPSPRPPSNLKAAFEKYTITWFTGVNTLFAALLAEPWFDRRMFENLRFCGSGGAAQQTGVALKWQERTGIGINQGYGMTEISGVLTLNPPSDNRFGKVGIPVPGAEIRIVDDDGYEVPLGAPGEVIARSPTLMKGYVNRPDATEEALRDGWLYTGDIGVMDADGFLEIVDRKKDMILVSGFNVSPGEIEDVISTVPGVIQVGVIGIPDDKTGETPVAFVVCVDEGPTEDAILGACREVLTNYKIPRQVRFVDAVPVTLTGKVLRRQLREDYLN
ncbi:AMP-binding protein [Ruegeria sp. 2012CJ41-6]|uniref:Long-chain-fatty-acid--CoA ligase n=1 Tax=Ruegeria spongiae TaxID=2942209 RepID=A0ABT0Q3G9_9RHOB|nr:AMP-binding protein [Ruegeria spongiae]MCL6283708.1 AMP-binding protein [Ruegeria spongiae]